MLAAQSQWFVFVFFAFVASDTLFIKVHSILNNLDTVSLAPDSLLAKLADSFVGFVLFYLVCFAKGIMLPLFVCHRGNAVICLVDGTKSSRFTWKRPNIVFQIKQALLLLLTM